MNKYDYKKVKLMLLFGILANIFFLPAIALAITKYNNVSNMTVFILFIISFIFFSIALFIGIKNIVLVRHIEYLKNKKNKK
ncbi:hypothetical protein SAMN02745111_01043 [Eubacterium uniforme]|uniref:Uncharacterized protein n=1 Tax=Eubacterium uniforme TaxID=39495 RepID=A0A1T4VJU8_9FIRM|nr:hypothetical protein [Eubacterium uniforme]SKA65196.1 hypothetical protein SAMN02745111_01043 [Eubacterium uniforme]